MTEDYIVYLQHNDSSGEILLLKGQLQRSCAPPPPKIFVSHMKYPKQTNGNDYRVYAIANMVSILHGVDPSIWFNVSVMG